MQHLFWLRENRIAGRSGPNLNPWDPHRLAEAGIGAVLSVNDAASVYPADLAVVGIEHACHSMEDNAPPRDGDFERALLVLPRALDYLDRVVKNGRIPLIHCSAGKDRTGLMMCYYLCQRETFAPQDAVAEVRRVRPSALSATDYEAFALEVLHALGRA